MSDERFISIVEEGEIKAVKDNGVEISLAQAIVKLNDYEDERKRKNRLISKYRKREEKYQRVISGLMAYLELRINEDLWWDWND